MKLTDLEIAQAKVRDWKDARAALLEIKGISMAVSVMRESKSPAEPGLLIRMPARLITPAVEAYIAELRTDLLLLGVTAIPDDRPIREPAPTADDPQQIVDEGYQQAF